MEATMSRPEPVVHQAVAVQQAHVLPVRVYYEDTDAGGIVYYANYLRFAERGRTEFLRARAPDAARALRDAGAAFAVRHCVADYRRPARLDDALDVHTRVTAIGGASLTMGQDIRRDGDILVDLVVKLVCIDRGGRPLRLGDELLHALNNGNNEMRQD
jgi:acyl-CoA thioester hydrolase